MNYDTLEADLWIAVIEQALFDATLGVSERIKHHPAPKPCSPCNYSCGKVPARSEVKEARDFLKSKDGALADICYALDIDYEFTRAKLLRVYKSCLPYLGSEWQDADFLDQRPPKC